MTVPFQMSSIVELQLYSGNNCNDMFASNSPSVDRFATELTYETNILSKKTV